MAMNLTTGKMTFPINFDNGDKAEIIVNPRDRSFLKALISLGESVEKKMQAIDLNKYKQVFEDGIKLDIDLNNDNVINNLTEERLKSLQNKLLALTDIDDEYQNVIKNELNRIFGMDVSSILFRYCQPLDYVVVINKEGKEESMPFVRHFIMEFAEEVHRYNKKHYESIEKHVGKYAK